LLFSFLNPDQKRPIICTSPEPISVDSKVSSTYLTSSDSRLLLHKSNDETVPLTTSQGWYLPPNPKLPPSGYDKDTDNIQASYSSSSQPCKPGHRLRSEVISKSEGRTFRQSESYSKLRSRMQSQHAQNAVGTETAVTQEPPPLPPKPKKDATQDRTSESSVTSVYQRTHPLPPKR